MFKFTQGSAGNVIIQDHMNKISAFIQDKLGAGLAALVLAGSFGRGEGSVLQHDGGRVEPINDYDFCIVLKAQVPMPPWSELAMWEKECSRLTGMRWIDFSVISKDRLSRLLLTQANYDLKFGGQVVTGCEDILDSIPDYRAESIPLKEAQTLLTTRFWCFIGTEPNRILSEPDSLTGEELRFVLQQLSKALIASGDSLLMLGGKYCVKYAEKARRIADLSGIQEHERRLMAWGYSYKLGETRELPEGYELRRLFVEALNVHLNIWDCIRNHTPLFKGLVSARLSVVSGNLSGEGVLQESEALFWIEYSFASFA